MQRPDATEHAEYYSLYIDRVPDGDILEHLRDQRRETLGLLRPIDDERAVYRYAPDKWSIKQVLGHVIDVERAFGFRAMAFARGESAPIPGLEQDEYVAAADFDARPMASLLEEYEALRGSHLALFGSFDEATGRRVGTASGCEFSVRAIPYILAGHERHHLGVLRERYL